VGHSVAAGSYARCETHHGLPWLRCYGAMCGKEHGCQMRVPVGGSFDCAEKPKRACGYVLKVLDYVEQR
jgi:hypothetical protein